MIVTLTCVEGMGPGETQRREFPVIINSDQFVMAKARYTFAAKRIGEPETIVFLLAGEPVDVLEPLDVVRKIFAGN